MASKQNADLVHHTNEGVEFHEDRANGSNKVVLRRPASLDSDVYIEFPTTSGVISTQTYVANATGGTFVGLSADFTNTDATSTPEDVTGMSFAVEAGRVYWVEIGLLWYDPSETQACQISLTEPASTTHLFTATYIGNSNLFGSGQFTGATYSQQNAGDRHVQLVGTIKTTNAGTVQLQFTNTAGNGTEQGLRKGSYIRIIDPQG